MFLDLQAHFPQLDWDDYGEGIRATFPNGGILLFVSRESGSPYRYCIRPLDEPLQPWLRSAWRRCRT